MRNNLHKRNRNKLLELIEDNSIAIIHSGYHVSRSADADFHLNAIVTVSI